MESAYVASVDVGTTSVRCLILNSKAEKCGFASSAVKLIYPRPGFVEIDPEELWEQTVRVIKDAITDANLTARDITCLGISTQRATFTTWARDTGKPFHNFITWKDIRAKELCKEINTSLYIRLLRSLAYSVYLVTRSDRFLTGSRLKVAPNHVTGRLLWVLQNNETVKTAIQRKNAMFGTVETWLLYKFTNSELFLSEISNASATGCYDSFIREWGFWLRVIFGVAPSNLFPKVVGNDYNFGSTARNIFGVSIPITCIMSDQTSSMYACCCFTEDDVKITLGTGAFLDVNTGAKIHTSVTGIYPVIGWKMKDDVVCVGEVACNDCGSLIQWLIHSKFVNDPSEIYEIVTSIQDSDGVYFVPAFSGLGPPINDERASSGFLGIKATTTKNHLVRSVLEGIVFRIVLGLRTLERERHKEYKRVIVDGGVSKNDFVCQMIADLGGVEVERFSFTEMTSLGVGFLAGLSAGIWKRVGDLKELNTIDKVFKPSLDRKLLTKYKNEFDNWLKVIERFKEWYTEED